MQSNFIVVRIMRNGAIILFASGRSLDRITIDGPDPLLFERIVVCDSQRIDTLLALPL